MKYRKKVHLLFALDDNYVPYYLVTLKSIVDNSSNKYTYDITIITEGLTLANRKKIKNVTQRKNFVFHFFDISPLMGSLSVKLDLRDYYTLTIYYRLFFPTLFPLKKKALYLDCDIAVQSDVAELFFTELGDNLLGAVQDASVQLYDEFGIYVNKVLRLEKEKYFNSGILLMNLEGLRNFKLEKKVRALIRKVRYIVAPDQDILNLLCKDKITYLDPRYNVMPLPGVKKIEDPFIIHYNLMFKPWNLKGILYEEVFWDYAHKVGVEKALKNRLDKIPEETTVKLLEGVNGVKAFCLAEADKADTYYCKAFDEKPAPKKAEPIEIKKPEPRSEREVIQARIEQYEMEGRFNEDVENDPPFRHLEPKEVDFFRKKLSSKFKTWVAMNQSRRYFNGLIKKGEILIDGYVGLDNLRKLRGGAIITLNHFNPFDSIALQTIIRKNRPGKKLYTVIKEANFSFPGLYGFFMRNCLTLPIALNPSLLNGFNEAVTTILNKGNYILIYPEQAMWWNYKKPRPMKVGAFKFAYENKAPILPCFITLKEHEVQGKIIEGYTLHILSPIYPDLDLEPKLGIEKMKKENEEAVKKVYEATYGLPLEYKTKK